MCVGKNIGKFECVPIQGAVLSTLLRPVKTKFDTPGLEEGIVGRIDRMLVVYYFVSPIFRSMYIGPYK